MIRRAYDRGEIAMGGLVCGTAGSMSSQGWYVFCLKIEDVAG